jgi:predicted dehydrogenase
MIRFATIGTSWITDEFIRSGRQVEGFCLQAVYSRNEETARQFAAKHEVKNVFTDLSTMAQSDSIDAVYIASPNSLHAQQALLFLNNKKHVLCEKPLASNAKEAAAMTKAAKANGVLLMEALKTAFMPAMQSVRENLDKIGKIRRYFASYCQYSSRYDLYKAGKNPNTFNPQFSNGALMDLGVYCLYPAIALFGRPLEIKASGLLLDSGVDGAGSIFMKYPEMDAVIMYSKITHSVLPSEIQGEKGSITIDKIGQPGKVQIYYHNGTTEDITPTQKDAMYYEIQEFIRLIKEDCVNSQQLSLDVIRVMDSVRQQIGLLFPADA